MLFRHFPRTVAAVATAAALTLTACSSEETGPQTEAAVGLPVDAARVTVQTPGEAERVLEYAAAGEQTVSVEVAEGFNQLVMQADAVDVQAPAGGDVTDPKLRDEELLQWMADFLSSMFDLDDTDVTGGEKKKKARGGKVFSVSE